jgi:AbrB family looped-hinge helix DNA binding protein
MKSADNTVTLSSKYQVVVPASLRESLKLKPGAKLTWIEIDGMAHLVPYKPVSAYRGIARGLTNSDIPNEPDRF